MGVVFFIQETYKRDHLTSDYYLSERKTFPRDRQLQHDRRRDRKNLNKNFLGLNY